MKRIMIQHEYCNSMVSKAGFTLVEVLVSVTIFALATLMISASLVVNMRIKEKVGRLRMVQEDARFLAEYLAREVESAEPSSVIIREPETGPLATESATLELRRTDDTGEQMLMKTFRPSVDGTYVEMIVEEGGQDPVFQRINSERTVLRNLRFYPLGACPNAPVDYVTAEFTLEEAPSKTGNTGGFLDKTLGSTTKVEMRIMAASKRTNQEPE